jgi:chitinase
LKLKLFIILAISLCLRTADAADFVVGYYPSWMQSELAPENLDMERLTHVVHAFAWPTAQGELVYADDFINDDLVGKVHENGGFILLALGGWGNSAAFATMSADSVARIKFIGQLLEFCLQHDYDGIDIDWEHPSNSQEKKSMTLLVRDMRAEFNKLMRPQPLYISMAVTAGNWAGQWLDYSELKKYIDWFGCMSYDFHGDWSNHAGHNSPLYASGGDRCGSVDSGIRYLTQTRGLPKDKVLLGVPFYGRGFNASGLYKPSSGTGSEHRYSAIPGMIGSGWTRHWDDVALVPYLINSDNTHIISYDDTLSVRFKAEYAVQHNLKGLMIWALGQDIINGDQALLPAVSDPILRPTGVTQKKTNIPTDFGLSCSPNPFNNAALISFSLKSEGFVTLDVLDLRGRIVSRLLSGVQPAGENRISFAANNLSSGVYLCRMTTLSDTRTIKLTLLQ